MEEIIKQNLQRGPYQTAHELFERAISLLHEQEVWWNKNRTEIAGKIEEGYAAAPRGELVDSDVAHRELTTLKSEG